MSALEERGRDRGVFWSANDLSKAYFPEPRWAVPGLVPEGLNLLVGAPKFGKSWLCLNLAVAIASGGKALGQIEVQQGSVLYAALEDTPRRLKSRLGLVLRGKPAPAGIDFVTDLPRLPDAATAIAGWLDDHEDARLVIVDVLRKIRPQTDGRGGRSAYDEDYDTLGLLKKLADQYKVAVVVVHHTRKMADESDVFNEVAGSTGITGAADAILVAKRQRNTDDAVIHLTGRDVNEAEFGVSWDATCCTWKLVGNDLADAASAAATAKITENVGGTMADLVRYVAERPKGVRAADAVADLGITDAQARRYLARAAEDGRLVKADRGLYMSVPSVPSVPLPSQSHMDNDEHLSRVSHSSHLGLGNGTHGTDGTPVIGQCLVCHQPLTQAGATTHATCDPNEEVSA